jgi:hypothetical protein
MAQLGHFIQGISITHINMKFCLASENGILQNSMMMVVVQVSSTWTTRPLYVDSKILTKLGNYNIIIKGQFVLCTLEFFETKDITT